ncbi:hypothetical protein GCM10027051_03110 [Niabella terrae]
MTRSTSDIDNILNSLDGIQPVEARPFMYTRVMARLEEQESFWSKAVAFIARPAIAISCLVVILGANFYLVSGAEAEAGQENGTAVVETNDNIETEIFHNNDYFLTASFNQ